MFVGLEEGIKIDYEDKQYVKNVVLKSKVDNIQNNKYNINIDFNIEVKKNKKVVAVDNKKDQIELNKKNIIKIIELNKSQNLYNKKILNEKDKEKEKNKGLKFHYKPNIVNEYLVGIIKKYAITHNCNPPTLSSYISRDSKKINGSKLEFKNSESRINANRSNKGKKTINCNYHDVNEIIEKYNATFKLAEKTNSKTRKNIKRLESSSQSSFQRNNGTNINGSTMGGKNKKTKQNKTRKNKTKQEKINNI